MTAGEYTPILGGSEAEERSREIPRWTRRVAQVVCFAVAIMFAWGLWSQLGSRHAAPVTTGVPHPIGVDPGSKQRIVFNEEAVVVPPAF